MAQPVHSVGARSGPGNRAIATTLLELLAVRGRLADARRAAQTIGVGGDGVAMLRDWLPEDAMGRLFEAGQVEAGLARSIGHRLVEPDATGWLLYGLGLATPEKAYRRVQALLPREGLTARWSIEAIHDGAAELCFRSSRSATARGATAEALCALRIGMLEAIPGLYGLLPARVHEKQCQASGADRCHYEIAWQRESRRGLLAGLALGMGAAAGWTTAAFLLTTGPAAAWTSGLMALAMIAVGGSIGRCLDLTRQLQAVAGSRRGQLALFDQADDRLASKIDALARVEAKLESEAGPRAGDTRGRTGLDGQDAGLHAGAGPDVLSIYDAALGIFAAAGALEQELAAREGGTRGAGAAGEEGDAASMRARVRAIREWASCIAVDSAPAEKAGRPLALAELVARAVASARPLLDPKTRIEVECEADLPLVVCEPISIEQVLIQLLRNASDSSAGLSDQPRVVIRVGRAPGAVELAVEDRGVGIDSSELDEVFDPFFAEAAPGSGEGLGLPGCLQIVGRHGGEMRIEAGDRAGTRVSILLPAVSEKEQS